MYDVGTMMREHSMGLPPISGHGFASAHTSVSKVDKGVEWAETYKAAFYNFYFAYFSELYTNYWQWFNLPGSIPEMWIEKQLFYKGYFAVFDSYSAGGEDIGLVASKGTMGADLDIYDNPTIFYPINATTDFKFNSIPINWYLDILDPKKAVIIQNDNFRQPAVHKLQLWCEELADIHLTIQISRNAQRTPYVIATNDEQVHSMKNIMNQVIGGNPFILFKEKKNSAGNLDAIQLSDRLQLLNLNVPFVLDKLHDEKQRIINQILTWVGINNNAVDKAERLVSAEATSNNGLINASQAIHLNARQEGVRRINQCWGPKGSGLLKEEIKVAPNPRIAAFNTEQLIDDIDIGIDGMYDVVETSGGEGGNSE